MNSISVLLIVKDEPAIEQTLTALKIQIEKFAAECLVVDASQGRLSDIQKKNPWVRWVAFEQPPGRRFTIPHQRNLALQMSAGDNVFFCDSGYIPSENWLASMNSALNSRANAIVGGPIIHRSGSKVIYTENGGRDGEIAKISTTANLGLKREILSITGSFDENFDYGSDADFIWRAADNGISHVIASGGELTVSMDSFKRDCKRFYRYGKARVRILRKHKKRIIPSIISSPDLVLYPFLLLSPLALFVFNSNVQILVYASSMVSVNIFLFIRNRKNYRDLALILKKYLYGMGMLIGILNIFTELLSNPTKKNQ